MCVCVCARVLCVCACILCVSVCVCVHIHVHTCAHGYNYPPMSYFIVMVCISYHRLEPHPQGTEGSNSSEVVMQLGPLMGKLHTMLQVSLWSIGG